MGEIYTVKMPDIGEGVVEGEVIEWLKKINDPVKQDFSALIQNPASSAIPAKKL